MCFQLLLIFFVMVWDVVPADDNLDESTAIKKIELLGGKITRDESLPGRRVVGVDLHRSNRFNDKYVHLLKSFKNLTTLNICETAITDGGLKDIGEFKGLKLLWIDADEITVEGLNELKKSLPNTKVYDYNPDELNAANEIIRLGGFVARHAKQGRCPVTEVSFRANKKLNDSHLHLLSECISLTMLDASFTDITDGGLKDIGRMTNLSNLFLDGTDITDAGLKEISGLTNLTFLKLTNTKITDDGLTEIGGFTNLRRLILDDTNITDIGLNELVNLPLLRELEIRNNPNITDNGIAELKQSLPKLKIVR